MTGSGAEAFDDFVRRRGTALLRVATLLSGDAGLAEDLVQTTLERIWPRWGKLTAAGSADGYAYTTMVNTWRSWRRRHWWREKPAMTVELLSTDGLDGRVATRESLRVAMLRLPPKQRAVLVLRYYADLSIGETAKILGCTEGTVKSQTADALTKLRRQWQQEADVGERE